MKIVLAANYHSYLGIKSDGDGLDEDAYIRGTKKLMEPVRTEIAG